MAYRHLLVFYDMEIVQFVSDIKEKRIVNSLILKAGRQKSLLRKHPWVFSGAIADVQGKPVSGETIMVREAGGKPLALAAYSPASQMRGRVWSFDSDVTIDANFFRHRLQTAFDRRASLGLGLDPDSALRLFYSESDGLPGLIIDRYADVLVCQFLTAGAEYWRDTIIEILKAICPGLAIYDRSDVEVREKEGLPQRSVLVCGNEPADRITITENDMQFLVDIRHGHKTGFYLDQRENRLKVQQYAKDKEVLNCFSYTGAFAVAALVGGAKSVVNIDSSGSVLSIAKDNMQLNRLDLSTSEFIETNVFEKLRAYRRQQSLFDLIVLDPPKLIESKEALTRGARAYKDMNMQAFALLRPGGILMTFSCSGLLDTQLYQKIVADAALDAGRQGRIIDRLGQSADHPVALNFPEAEYLKGFCIQVD